MPFLKKKIFMARRNMLASNMSDDEDMESHTKHQESLKPRKTEAVKHVAQKKEKTPYQVAFEKRELSKPSSKNIVKNYGKAMCSFASSPIALPYLERLNTDGRVNLREFQDHIHKKRDLIDSIDSLRRLLLIMQNDDSTLIGFKKIFQEISIIFIKYFSVNWIFQGKMSHKQAHLRSRFKMLRRIQNPQYFTYFKDFSR